MAHNTLENQHVLALRREHVLSSQYMQQKITDRCSPNKIIAAHSVIAVGSESGATRVHNDSINPLHGGNVYKLQGRGADPHGRGPGGPRAAAAARGLARRRAFPCRRPPPSRAGRRRPSRPRGSEVRYPRARVRGCAPGKRTPFRRRQRRLVCACAYERRGSRRTAARVGTGALACTAPAICTKTPAQTLRVRLQVRGCGSKRRKDLVQTRAGTPE